jgi:hypothetical protein
MDSSIYSDISPTEYSEIIANIFADNFLAKSEINPITIKGKNYKGSLVRGFLIRDLLPFEDEEYVTIIIDFNILYPQDEDREISFILNPQYPEAIIGNQSTRHRCLYDIKLFFEILDTQENKYRVKAKRDIKAINNNFPIFKDKEYILEKIKPNVILIDKDTNKELGKLAISHPMPTLIKK